MAFSFVRKELISFLVILLPSVVFADTATRLVNVGSVTSGGKVVDFDFSDLPEGSIVNQVGLILSFELWSTSDQTLIELQSGSENVVIDQPLEYNGAYKRTIVFHDSAAMIWQTLQSSQRAAAHNFGDYSIQPKESLSAFDGGPASEIFTLTVDGITLAGNVQMSINYTAPSGGDDTDGGGDDSGGDDDGGGDNPDDPTGYLPDGDGDGPDDPIDDGPTDDDPTGYDGNNDGIDQSGDGGTNLNYGAVLPGEFTNASEMTFGVELERAAGSGQGSGMWGRGDGSYGTDFIGGFGNLSASEYDGGDHSVSLPIYQGPLASLGTLDVSIMPPDYWPASEVYALLSALLGAGLLFKITRTVRQY